MLTNEHNSVKPQDWARFVDRLAAVDVAIQRFQQNFPDVSVTLIVTGQTFDEVAAVRLFLEQEAA